MRCVHEECRANAPGCFAITASPRRTACSRRERPNGRRVQVGTGRTVLEVAEELSCDWHTVNDAVTTYGEALLEADRKRLNRTSAIGLDETSFVQAWAVTTPATRRRSPTSSTTRSSTSCPPAQLRGRGGLSRPPAREAWKARITYGALDMSTAYAAVYSVILPKAAQVVDPFHVVSLANRTLDAVRRRVQNEQTRTPRPARRPALSRADGAPNRRRETRREVPATRLRLTARPRRPQRRGGHCLSGQRTAS